MDKVKSLFGLGSSTSLPNSSATKLQPKEYILTPQITQEISTLKPAKHRLKQIKNLTEVVQTKRLEENGTEVLWECTKDLLLTQTAVEDRQIMFRFLNCLIKGQFDQLQLMRVVFFRALQNDITSPEDAQYRFELYQTLTANGKNLDLIEEDSGDFVLQLMNMMMGNSKRLPEFLTFLCGIIKSNSAYLGEDALLGIVWNVCHIGLQLQNSETEMCLNVLDAVLTESYLPSGSVSQFIIFLCQVVNQEKLAQQCWIVMRKLLETTLGHSAVLIMCHILQDRNNATAVGSLLIRGAIFFIGMALWGSKRVTGLTHPAASILSSFSKALLITNSVVVLQEIILTIHRLVSKFGASIQSDEWDIILDITASVLQLCQKETICPANVLSSCHDVLSTVEHLYEKGNFCGCIERLFDIVETCADQRPENSLLSLISYRIKHITPAEINWLDKMNVLLHRYYVFDPRSWKWKYGGRLWEAPPLVGNMNWRQCPKQSVRIKLLEMLSSIVGISTAYRDDLINMVVLPHAENIDDENDPVVQLKFLQLLIDLAESCETDTFFKLGDIVKKTKVESWTAKFATRAAEEEFCAWFIRDATSLRKTSDRNDAAAAGVNIERMQKITTGILQIFQKKLVRPQTSHSVYLFDLLVAHVCHLLSNAQASNKLPSSVSSSSKSQPNVAAVADDTGQIRRQILEYLMNLRVNDLYHVGLAVPDNAPIEYSAYLICRPRDNFLLWSGMNSINPVNPACTCTTVVLPCEDAFSSICLFIEQEMNWTVLNFIFEKLPSLLQNKNLLSASYPRDVDRICIRLCKMLNDVNIHQRLINVPAMFNRSDLQAQIFPILTSLVSFHFILDRTRQMELVRCLEYGLVSRCSRICVRALTVCALEMRNAMMRQLPSILLKLSQISATNSIAIPLMEFLSSLIHLPDLYSNFVETEYKSVFAIALPYTNPYRYNLYTVSVAYHVIAMWFIKCRLPFRRSFVRYIIKGLKVNVLRQIEEVENQSKRSTFDDSSVRTRAHSLGQEALRNDFAAVVKRIGRPGAKEPPPRAPSTDEPSVTDATTTSIAAIPDQKVASTFHKELLDTCIDMLSRYAHFTSASFPKRSPVSKFLLSGGQKQSWLLGNSIITVTTSGGARVTKSGLCENCVRFVRSVAGSAGSGHNEDEHSAASKQRQRHKSEAVIKYGGGGGGNIVPLLKPLSSRDDIAIHRQIGAIDTPATVAVESSTLYENGSLDSSGAKRKAVDNVLIGLTAQQPSIFRAHVCNCWCTQWAELYIRRPTGNFSWMMHLQNEQDLMSMFPDFVLSDISNLFMPVQETEDDLVADPDTESSDILINPALPPDVEKTIDSEVHRASSSPDLLRNKAGGNVKISGGDDNDDRQEPSDAVQVVRRTSSLSTADRDRYTIRSQTTRRNDERHQLIGAGGQSAVGVGGEIASSGDVSLTSSSTNRRAREILSSVSEENDATGSAGLLTQQPKQQLGATTQGGINPSFIFLQLFQNQCFKCNDDNDQLDRLVPLPNNESTDQSINTLDMIQPYETYKVGVVYIKPGQTKNEVAILSNMYGSMRYVEFIQRLGTILRLSETDLMSTYIGGMDRRGTDGPFLCSWQAEFMQVVFHIATLMPCHADDPMMNEKKKHIGNDYVTIVYNDSGEDYRMGTIRSQFNYVNIIIQPLDQNFNRITVQTKPEIEDLIGHTDTKLISDNNLALLVRQMAVHANLASTIYARQKIHPMNPYASNWLERLRKIRLMRERLAMEKTKAEAPPTSDSRSLVVTPKPVTTVDDFSDFVK